MLLSLLLLALAAPQGAYAINLISSNPFTCFWPMQSNTNDIYNQCQSLPPPSNGFADTYNTAGPINYDVGSKQLVSFSAASGTSTTNNGWCNNQVYQQSGGQYCDNFWNTVPVGFQGTLTTFTLSVFIHIHSFASGMVILDTQNGEQYGPYFIRLNSNNVELHWNMLTILSTSATPATGWHYHVAYSLWDDGAGNYFVALYVAEYDSNGFFVRRNYLSTAATQGHATSGAPNKITDSRVDITDVGMIIGATLSQNQLQSLYPSVGMSNAGNPCSGASGNCLGCVDTYGGPTWSYTCNNCANMRYGTQCTLSCPGTCTTCNRLSPVNQNNYLCTACQPGFYSKATGCNLACPASCVPDQCVDAVVNGTVSYRCNQCEQGFFGPQCQYSCSTANNCVPGSCVTSPSDPNSFTCNSNCFLGWVGPQCTTQCTGQADPSSCVYNATSNDYYYLNAPQSCRTGWIGSKCNIQCSPLCGGASNCALTTVSGVQTFQCMSGCPGVPYWGFQCQTPTCQTNENPSRLNWQVNLNSGFVSNPPQVGYPTTSCSCYNNWYDPVLGQLTQLGLPNATCSQFCTQGQGAITLNTTSSRYYCNCNPGFTGSQCQTRLCTSYADPVHGVCLNGGTCSDNNATTNAYCVCPSGWVGNTTCSIKVGLDVPVNIQTQMVFRYPMTQTPIVDVVSNSVLTGVNNQLALAWYTTPNMGNVFGLNMQNTSSNVNTTTPTGTLTQFTMTAWIQPHTALPSDYLYTPLVTKNGFGAIGIQRVAGVTLTPYCSVGTTSIGVSAGLPAMSPNQLVFVACSYNITHLTLTALYYDTNGYLTIPTVTSSKSVATPVTVSVFQFQYSTLNTFVTDVTLFPAPLTNTTLTSLYPAVAYTYNPCSINTTCQNGASCTALGGNSFTCGCTIGFNGTNCQNKLCAAFSGGNPCLHGATCNDNGGTSNFQCGCRAPYEGSFCDRCSITSNTDSNCVCQNSTYSVVSGVGPLVSLNDSCSASCTNGAVTKLPNNTYYCACKPGYSPPDCSVPIDYCNTNLYSTPCQNGGTCSYTGPGKFNCTCPGGVTGPSCTTQLNYCNATQFNQAYVCGAHGTCINDGGGNYHCNCSGIYTGADCSQVINPCLTTPCANGAQCTPHADATYNCNCTNSWYGAKCDQWNNPCASSPCQHNGTCYSIPGYSSYTCVCGGGWTGPTCTAQTCALYGSCQHGGFCADAQGLQQASCHCVGPWTGTNCTACYTAMNTVASNCTCAAGYYSVRSAQGPLFDTTDNCNNLCVHGYVDLNPFLQYYCHCNTGWQGAKCDQWVDPCASVSCLHGGKCNSTYGQTGFNCSCATGWNGTFCGNQQCVVAAGASINTTTCACTGNNYHPTYGQTSQLGVIPATCPSQCLFGQVTQGLYNTSFNCTCPPGFTGASCAVWRDPCGVGASTACGGGNYLCSSTFGDTVPTCIPYTTSSFLVTYAPYLGGFGGTSVVGLLGIFLWDRLYASWKYVPLPTFD